MSEVYSIEPKTHGKVIIYTSLGELEIHLFSNECPEACRNFIQHCLNNYYNKNEFFRVIPRFLIQTGDHTNTGLHNEYAFSSPFKNEYNSRLKFLYTGCLSFANLNIDKPSNGSQFFITLDKAEYLNNKNTLFGKVAKHSIYNLLKFNNIKTNKHDKPIEDIPYIEYVKIIENPFHHLVPSINYEYNTKNQNVKDKNEYLNKTKKKKEQNLLSFDYDQEISDDSETFFRGDKDQTVKQKNVSSYDKFGNVEDNKGEDDKGEDIILPYNLVHKVLIKTKKMLEENIKSSVINLDMSKKSKDTKLIILGDVHGQLHDVLWLFNRFGIPSSTNIYIFNGDIADRGENATEIFILLFIFKLSCNDSVIINRGNHECSYMNEVYGFYNEGT
ncbi:hypothetical protein PFNF54_05257 [Plasmodium falciparum NF54]|uniref:PPIase cyclophilin-type domain-containing protein n=1 Tax=Plasmodium falciparum (isolate NF54) TaxID=5843 RepID=W7JXZ7_PLAFO|nr:hypothetical protein PFNF54_05257 [Plasmodium falciparum NF54]